MNTTLCYDKDESQNIKFSEISQTQKDIIVRFHLYKIERKQISGFLGWGSGTKVDCSGAQGSFWSSYIGLW